MRIYAARALHLLKKMISPCPINQNIEDQARGAGISGYRTWKSGANNQAPLFGQFCDPVHQVSTELIFVFGLNRNHRLHKRFFVQFVDLDAVFVLHDI